MKYVLILSFIGAALANENFNQQQYQMKSGVKGGQGGWFYNPTPPPGSSLVNFGNGNRNGTYMRHNLTGEPADLEVGVCYIEVPTRQLILDPSVPVPAGNGSSPEYSIIRSCCKGYTRNTYSFKKCDPVCTEECINGICSAPDVCTCFPDHVKNLAGVCIPQCPIGCQNGFCHDLKCFCKEGYKLEPQGKFCVPSCKENCGGIGNCTSPDTCECKQGYKSGPGGSCQPACEHCTNGDCVAPGECKCHQGYMRNAQGICVSICAPGYQNTPQGCKPVCGICENGQCVAPNNCLCNPGYTKNQQGQCVEQCKPGYETTPMGCKLVCSCPNGECVIGGECRCHPGYVNREGVCVPLCNPACGPNIRCVAPNLCDQQPQQPQQPHPTQPTQFYQPTNNTHPLTPDNQHLYPQLPTGVPQCSQPCLNGYCVEGNRCNCNPGYQLDNNDPTGSRCMPYCAGGCHNGVCSGPNLCICNMGYFKNHSVKGRAVCVKREKRSADQPESLDIAKLLTFKIPDYDIDM